MAAENRLVQKPILKFLKEYQAKDPSLEFFRREAGGFAYKKGLPDLWILYRGVHVEVECKDEDGEPDPLQLKWEERLKRAGALYCRPHSFTEFKEFFYSVFQN